mgnify:CR=1 FL=1
MLETITSGFNKARDRFQGRIELTEGNIEDALKDIRLSLLDADVNLNVVKGFISRVKDKAIGEVVDTRVTHKGKKLKVAPGDHFINICYEELVALMGPVDTSFTFGKRPVSAIMLLGLQGCCLGNGILTVENRAQAEVRADPAGQNKGGGAAAAALHLIALSRKWAGMTKGIGFRP